MLSTFKNSTYLGLIVVLSLVIRMYFSGQHDLLAEEAYYWNYAHHLDWGYLDHPPMVALLIKLSTSLLGLNELGVRAPAMLCWMITAYFSYRCGELLEEGLGIYLVFLLSILPFFFIYSLIITPDLPLMACWSAALYFLYRALCQQEARAWYGAGIALGLGLQAKYTMSLIVLTTGLYVLTVPQARFWFGRKEPYYALGIGLLLFTPVIYWNATHAWVSFAFQSIRRFQGSFRCSLHELMGLLVLFLTPLGLTGLYKLFKKECIVAQETSRRFLQYYTLVPIAIFTLFSFTRDIKSNWIGVGLLALLPWLAQLMRRQAGNTQRWLAMGLVLLLLYTGMLICISTGRPEKINHSLFSKMISWENLSQEFYKIVLCRTPSHQEAIIIALDSYSIASELSFYQAKHLHHHPKDQMIRIHGADALGYNSLMFRYWYGDEPLQHKTVLLLGKTSDAFHLEGIKALSPIIPVWGVSQGQHIKLRQYYYQMVQFL